jgi:hypothetical protein
MDSLQPNGTIPHPLRPARRGGLSWRRRALPSPSGKLGLESCPAALRVCGEELAAESWARSAEELGGCGHCVELQENNSLTWVHCGGEIDGGRMVKFPFFDDTDVTAKEIDRRKGRQGEK